MTTLKPRYVDHNGTINPVGLDDRFELVHDGDDNWVEHVSPTHRRRISPIRNNEVHGTGDAERLVKVLSLLVDRDLRVCGFFRETSLPDVRECLKAFADHPSPSYEEVVETIDGLHRYHLLPDSRLSASAH
jgi:hypothetical protein